MAWNVGVIQGKQPELCKRSGKRVLGCFAKFRARLCEPQQCPGSNRLFTELIAFD